VSDYKRGFLLILFGGVFLSTLGIGTRLTESASGMQIVFYRGVGLAVFATALLVFKHGRRSLAAFTESGRAGFIAGVFLSLASMFIVLALVRTTAANAMFIVSLAPLLSAVFAWLILGEKVATKTWIAIGIAIAGVSIIINGAVSTQGMSGIIFAFLMAISYGMFVVALRMGKDQEMLPTMCWSAYILVIVLAFGLDDLSVPLQDIIIGLLLGVFQVGLGCYLLILGSKHVPAAQLTLFAMMEVVLNPIWVWLGVGEVPTNATLIGGAIILVAICYEALAPKRESLTH